MPGLVRPAAFLESFSNVCRDRNRRTAHLRYKAEQFLLGKCSSQPVDGQDELMALLPHDQFLESCRWRSCHPKPPSVSCLLLFCLLPPASCLLPTFWTSL